LDSSPPRHRRDFLVNNRNSKLEHPFSNQKSNTNNLFGSNAFGNQTTGTDIKFSPVTGTYTTQQQPGFGATLFDTPRSNTTNSLFGQTNNKTGFGQPQDFGQTPSFGSSTIAFGVPNQTNTSSLFGKPTTFVTTTSNASSTFGFNPPSTSNPFSKNEAQKSFSQPLFRTTTTQLQSAFSTGVFGQTNTPVRNTTTNPFQKPAQTTTGFNTEQPGCYWYDGWPGTTEALSLVQDSKVKNSDSFNQTQASNLTQVCNLNSFEVDASTSTISTIGVGQSTLTFGVTNQINTSILFNEPPPIVKFASLKKELKNKKIVTEKLSNKSNIMSKSKERESDAVNSLKMVEKLANEIEELITKVGKKQRNEVEELLIKIEEAKRECKLKEEVHRVLTDNWNVERDNFNTQIEKLNKTILTLEMTNGSKEKLIQRLNENLKKDRESVSKANFNIGELRVQIWKEILSKNNGNLGYDANTGTNVLAKSVMEKETIEK
jgi:uncharacterized coiled-coil protein SlyX